LEGRVRRKFGVLEPRTFSFKDRWCNDNVTPWWTIVWRLFNTGAHRNTIYRYPERDWRSNNWGDDTSSFIAPNARRKNSGFEDPEGRNLDVMDGLNALVSHSFWVLNAKNPRKRGEKESQGFYHQLCK
jgi:hypothetical protein